VYALETVFDILMDNCVDLNTPITYQFFYYDSQTALAAADYLNFVDSFITAA